MITTMMANVVSFVNQLMITGLYVTDEALTAANHLNQNRVVALVNPPAITPASGGVYELEFSLIVATGPFEDPDRATQVLSPIVGQLMDSNLMPSRATPNTFESFNGRNYPCYVLTFTTDSD